MFSQSCCSTKGPWIYLAHCMHSILLLLLLPFFIIVLVTCDLSSRNIIKHRFVWEFPVILIYDVSVGRKTKFCGLDLGLANVSLALVFTSFFRQVNISRSAFITYSQWASIRKQEFITVLYYLSSPFALWDDLGLGTVTLIVFGFDLRLECSGLVSITGVFTELETEVCSCCIRWYLTEDYRNRVLLILLITRPSQWTALWILLVCPSVCMSVCPVQAFNSKRKRHRKTKIAVNVPQGGSKRCTIFQAKSSKVSIMISVVWLVLSSNCAFTLRWFLCRWCLSGSRQNFIHHGPLLMTCLLS